MWTPPPFFVFIEFSTMFVLCFFWLRGIWNLSSQTGIEPSHPAFEGEVLLAKVLAFSVTEMEF